MTSMVFAQAVRDRNVIPVAVNLNQVLRMTITNGGNIEFVFNSIDDYKYGISANSADVSTAVDPDVSGYAAAANPAATTGGGAASATNFYKTDFTVASSTRWKLEYGAEELTFIGTDDPSHTLALDNVGFELVNNGSHNFEAIASAQGTSAAAGAGTGVELFSAPTDNANSVTALVVYPSVDPLIEDNNDVDDANAGDGTDNSFTLLWRCGTTEAGTGGLSVTPMASSTILNQGNINPDRYVVNVVFELATDF